LLIKIDIDGGEFFALRGAARLLATHRPALITEFCPGLLADISGVNAYTYLDWLRAQGYALAVIPDEGPLPEADSDNAAILAALSRRGTDHVDLFARPLDAAPPRSPARRPPPVAAPPPADVADQLAAANRHAAEAERRARAAEQQTVLLQARLAETTARIAVLAPEAAQAAALRAEAQRSAAWLAAIRASTSWRLTAPLRRLLGAAEPPG
jgi:hypothetical protein